MFEKIVQSPNESGGFGKEFRDVFKKEDDLCKDFADAFKKDGSRLDFNMPDIFQKSPDYSHAPVYEKSEVIFNKNTGDIKEPEKAELSEKRGGSYGELKEAGYGWPDHEVHHMPADSASELPSKDGPAIVMDYEDHRQTASYGGSKEAREYRQKQSELIEDGKFDEALQMDIDDIHEKFGDKYDDAIADMKQYAETLKEEGHA